MLHFFPYLREQIFSRRTREDICMILQSVTDSRKFLLHTDAEYTGQIYPSHFKICPGKNYNRNSFLPVITGTVTEREEGCAVDIVMRLHMFVCLFMAVWFGGLFLFLLLVLLDVIIKGFDDMLFIVFPIFMIICAQIIMRRGFYGPARKALVELKELIC